MVLGAWSSLGMTLALLATFLGVGVLVGMLVFYIVAQVLAEHEQSQETHEAGG
jgi:hypothetical protein